MEEEQLEQLFPELYEAEDPQDGMHVIMPFEPSDHRIVSDQQQ